MSLRFGILYAVALFCLGFTVVMVVLMLVGHLRM